MSLKYFKNQKTSQKSKWLEIVLSFYVINLIIIILKHINQS